MEAFTYESHARRVVFGVGAARGVGGELERLGKSRAVVLSTPGHAAEAARFATEIGARCVGLIATARMHVPTEVAKEAAVRAKELAADATIGFGGGSTIGLGKAIALELGLPQIAVPTSYSGSEMTTIWGLTENGVKRTGRDVRVLPVVVIYDPALTAGLPAKVTAASGLNAMAHAVEALWSVGANPVTTILSEEAVRAIATALPGAVADEVAARGELMYGASLAGHALASVPMALHHQLCHVIGGAFDVPHAELHALVLPHVVRWNGEAAPAAIERLARAMGASEPAQRLREHLDAFGLRASLSALGVPREGATTIVSRVCEKPYPNPRPVNDRALWPLVEALF